MTRQRLEIPWTRLGVIIFFVVFIWVQLNFTTFHTFSERYRKVNDSDAAILSMVPLELRKFISPKTKEAFTNEKNASRTHTIMPNVSEIKRRIEHHNLQQVVNNEDVFGPLQNDSIVIVVQVHDRITHLRHLIVSLAQAPGISQALVIFSHDIYDEDINSLVGSVDFCKVLQIFYPYSIQTHPREFPGDDPGDCPRDMKAKEAALKMCNNVLYPDIYGHYREAKFTQTKHHWWWKANRVFGQLEATRFHTGPVVFLEEDHYVAEDFLHLLKLMERNRQVSCKFCNVLALGTHRNIHDYRAYGDAVEVTPWTSGKHNMGMAFDRSTWRRLHACARYFCEFDDYNWDWSLQHVSQNCLKQQLYAMAARATRVFHVGECGVHHKKNNCKKMSAIYRAQRVLRSAGKYLFPERLTLTFKIAPRSRNLRKGNGGWGDRRDHELCMRMTVG